MIFTPVKIGNILNYVLELAIILYTLKYIFLIPLTKSNIKKFSAITLSAIWLLYTLISDSPYPQTFIILPISLLLFSEHIAIILFSVISSTLAIISINSICLYLCIIVMHISQDSNLLSIYNDTVSLIFIFTILIKFNKKIQINIAYLKKLDIKNFILIFLMVIIDFFLSSISSLLFYDNINHTGRRILLLAIYTMLTLSIIILILYLRIVRIRSELEQLNNIKSKMLSLEEQHYKDMLEKNSDLRAFRHDYNYHITALQALAQNNDFNKLKDYINHLTQIKTNLYYISTNNTISDAIVNYFYENIPNNTEFKIDGKFSENTFINNDDICVILSNLLKNAYEAICKSHEYEQGIDNDNTDLKKDEHIYISLYEDKNNITIYIENTYNPHLYNNNTDFSTSKSDIINHGFGLKNVRTVVKKYNGKLELKTDKNIFSAYVFLHNTL